MTPHVKWREDVPWSRLVPYASNFLIVNVVYWFIRANNWWHFFGFTVLKPSFADLRAYTSAVTCSENGTNFLIVNCDPWRRNIGLLRIYVPPMKFFHLNESHTALIGNSMQVLLFLSIFSIAYMLRINLRPLKTTVITLIFLISPPFAFLIERGQLEIILFVLITLSAYLISTNKKTTAYLLLGFVSIMKLYPIFLFGFVLINLRKKNSRIQNVLGLAVFVLALGSVLTSLWGEGNNLWSGTLAGSPWQIFGVVALPFILMRGLNHLTFISKNFELSASQAQFAGTALFIIILIVLQIFRSRGKVFKPDLSYLLKKESFIANLLLFTLIPIYLSYFLVSSSEYRMVYLAPLFLIGIVQFDVPEKNSIGNYLVYGSTIAMWAQVNHLTSASVQLPLFLILVVIFFNVVPTCLQIFLGVQ